MAIRNLWGFSPSETPIYTPVQILREQVEQFNKIWKNSSLYAEISQTDRSSDLEYSLIVIAPVLNGYKLNIMAIRYKILGYPVSVYSDFGGVTYGQEVNSDEEYLEIVSKILSDSKLAQSIKSLAAHSVSS